MRILIALDGTPIGESAVAAIRPLAESAGAEVHLFTVIHPEDAEKTFAAARSGETTGADGTEEPADDAFAFAVQGGERFLRGVADQYLAGADVSVWAEVSREPAAGIVSKATGLQVDVIAMGTRGRGGIGRALLGSVAEKVVREAEAPVYLVGPRMRSALAEMHREEVPAPAGEPQQEPAQAAQGASAWDAPTERLVDWLASPDWQLRRQAKEALISRGPEVVPAMIEALGSSNDNIRWGAVKVLHELEDERALPALVERMEDSNPTVRWAAGEALLRAGQASVLPILRRLLTHADSVWLQEGSHYVLQRLVEPTISPVVDALEGHYPSITVPPRVNEALKKLEGFD